MYIQILQVQEVMDIANMLQTGASVLMPILAVIFKVYTDKQKLETQALISESHTELVKHSDKNKKEVLGLIAGINEKLTINITEDKNRDRELKRLSTQIDKL